MIDIDGSFGEGGGQILRTSLALSMLTGEPFAMRNIRANRAKPGLRRQHSACVEVARMLCNGVVRGNTVDSSYLEFTPGAIVGGEHTVDIGSMGSTTLVMQTVLVPVIAAGHALTLTVRGGTHNPMAPPFEFLDRVYLPCLKAMGARVKLTLDRHGFVSGRGEQGELGQLTLRIDAGPAEILEGRRALGVLDLDQAPEIQTRRATILLAGLPRDIADRERKVIRERLGVRECEVREIENAGIGNAVQIEFARKVGKHYIRELVTEVGEKGVRAELVAERACEQAERYLAADVLVGEHLADQLLLPFVIAHPGRFRTGPLSLHATTNIATIGKFLEVPIEVMPDGDAVIVTVGKRR